MARFTKRPVTIDAILASEVMDGASSGRFSVKSENRMPMWIVEAFEQGVIGFQSGPNGAEEVMLINTKEGQMRGERTDWIIRGVQGELYPCKPDIFAATYDVGEGPHPITVLQMKGDITPEQFKKFRAEWEASHASISKSMLKDVETNTITAEEVALLREVATRDTLGEGYGLAINKLLGGGAADVQPPPPTSPKMITDFKITHVAVTEHGFEIGGTTPIVDQPPPTPQGLKRAVWEMVIEDYQVRYAQGLSIDNHEARYVIDDMTARDAIGRERYGTPLTAFNGRDALVDAYQEQLDAAVYLRQAIEEGLPVRASYDETLGNITRLRALINERTTNAKK